MAFYSNVVSFFQDGGPFLYVMAALFVAGMAIAVERFLVLTRESAGNRALWERLTPCLKSGNFTEATNIASKSTAALGSVLAYGLARTRVTHRRDDIEKAMEESLLEVIPRLEKRTHYLSSMANLGMLIGLLGTVAGLIAAFGAIATANPAEKASLLAASISVAMNNTAAGLGVAISLLAAHMFLETKTTALIDSLEVAALKFLNTMSERGQATTSPQPTAPAPAPVAPRTAPARGVA
jgi:biopolymer transport protein ExbB/TolQ